MAPSIEVPLQSIVANRSGCCVFRLQIGTTARLATIWTRRVVVELVAVLDRFVIDVAYCHTPRQSTARPPSLHGQSRSAGHRSGPLNTP